MSDWTQTDWTQGKRTCVGHSGGEKSISGDGTAHTKTKVHSSKKES